MKPGVKLAVLLVALMVPYMSFFVYFALRYPSGHLPEWLVNTVAVWFLANFAIIFGASRVWFRKTEPATFTSLPVQNSYLTRGALWRASSLVVFWSCLFLYGAVQTVEGKFPLHRAIPAGLFLLVFIVLFSTLIYKERSSSKA